MIKSRIDCDVHRITAADPDPTDYEETVARNVREQDDDARPAVAAPLGSIDRYDTILLASPIWNVRPPMIMATFTERYDFAGKTAFPAVTYAVSGLGNASDDYERLCDGARIGDGLAVRGERVRSGGPQVDRWLRPCGTCWRRSTVAGRAILQTAWCRAPRSLRSSSRASRPRPQTTSHSNSSPSTDRPRPSPPGSSAPAVPDPRVPPRRQCRRAGGGAWQLVRHMQSSQSKCMMSPLAPGPKSVAPQRIPTPVRPMTISLRMFM